MSKPIQPNSDLQHVSDRALEEYIQSHQLVAVEIDTAQKEYSRRWWRSLFRQHWPVLLFGLMILFSLLLWIAFAIQDRKASVIVLPALSVVLLMQPPMSIRGGQKRSSTG
jgi:hypothetical protein